MNDDGNALLQRLIGGNADARAEVVEAASASDWPPMLVAGALLAHDAELLARATRHATSIRDRQLVALADAHLRGDDELFDALVRDHLAGHPDHVLAAWIAGEALRRRS